MKLKLKNTVSAGKGKKLIAPPADGGPVEIEDEKLAQSLIDRGAAEEWEEPAPPRVKGQKQDAPAPLGSHPPHGNKPHEGGPKG